MKHFFIQYGRFFLLAFVVGFLFPRLSADTVQSDAVNYDNMESLDEMILAFHKDMNDTTNIYLERMFDEDQPAVLYPSTPEGCDDNNVSTYCLASKLNEKLLAFELALSAKKNGLEDLSSMVDEEEGVGALDTLDEAIQFANQQESVVEEQMQNAEDALDLTLSVYNQIQIVWPLHQELQDFRENLENFRDNLALVRDVIELYPSKFNGASTAQCK